MQQTKKFSYQIDDLDSPETTSGARISLYLDTDDRKVFTYRFIGGGYLAGDHLVSLGEVTGLVGEALEENLKAKEDRLQEICEANNQDEDQFRRDELAFEFANRLKDEEIAAFWDASDWLSPAAEDTNLLRQALLRGAQKAAEAEVAAAREMGAYLDAEDVEDYLTSIPENEIRNLEDAAVLIADLGFESLEAELVENEESEELVLTFSDDSTTYDDPDDVIEVLEDWATDGLPSFRCRCGEVTGVRCACVPREELVVVEYVAPSLRASHEAAGNRGVFPLNGSVRLPVAQSCAEQIVQAEPDWAEIIEGRSYEGLIL